MAFWGVARIGRQRIPSQLQNCSSRFYTSCKTSLIFKAYPGLEAQLEHFLVRVAGHPFYIKTLKATESRSRLYQWITLENISAINGPTLLSEKTQYPWKPQLWHPHPRIPVHMLRFYLWSRCPYSAQIYEQLMAQYTATSKQDLVTYLVQLVPWIALFAYLDGTGTPIQKTPQAAVTLNIWRSPSTLNPFISEADAELLDRQLTDLWATIRQETVAFSSLGSTSTSHPGAQDQNSVRLLQTDVCETSAQNRNVLMTSSCHDIPTDLRYSIVLDICGNDVNILAQYFCDQSKRSDPRRHVGRYFKQKASSAVKNENNNTFGNTTPPWSLINNTSFDIPEQAAHRPESSTNSSDSDEQQNILFCTERPGPAHTHFFDQRSAKEETALDQDRLTFCTNKQTKDHLLQINGENILQVFDQLPMTATSAVLYSIASALTEQLIPSSQTDAQTSTHSSRYIVRRPYYLDCAAPATATLTCSKTFISPLVLWDPFCGSGSLLQKCIETLFGFPVRKLPNTAFTVPWPLCDALPQNTAELLQCFHWVGTDARHLPQTLIDEDFDSWSETHQDALRNIHRLQSKATLVQGCQEKRNASLFWSHLLRRCTPLLLTDAVIDLVTTQSYFKLADVTGELHDDACHQEVTVRQAASKTTVLNAVLPSLKFGLFEVSQLQHAACCFADTPTLLLTYVPGLPLVLSNSRQARKAFQQNVHALDRLILSRNDWVDVRVVVETPAFVAKSQLKWIVLRKFLDPGTSSSYYVLRWSGAFKSQLRQHSAQLQ